MTTAPHLDQEQRRIELDRQLLIADILAMRGAAVSTPDIYELAAVLLDRAIECGEIDPERVEHEWAWWGCCYVCDHCGATCVSPAVTSISSRCPVIVVRIEQVQP